MSARSGFISAVTAAHPAMAVLCSGDVGWCPPYSTLFAAGPETEMLLSVLLLSVPLLPSALVLLVLLALPVQVEAYRREPGPCRVTVVVRRGEGEFSSLLLSLLMVLA